MSRRAATNVKVYNDGDVSSEDDEAKALEVSARKAWKKLSEEEKQVSRYFYSVSCFPLAFMSYRCMYVDSVTLIASLPPMLLLLMPMVARNLPQSLQTANPSEVGVMFVELICSSSSYSSSKISTFPCNIQGRRRRLRLRRAKPRLLLRRKVRLPQQQRARMKSRWTLRHEKKPPGAHCHLPPFVVSVCTTVSMYMIIVFLYLSRCMFSSESQEDKSVMHVPIEMDAEIAVDIHQWMILLPTVCSTGWVVVAPWPDLTWPRPTWPVFLFHLCRISSALIYFIHSYIYIPACNCLFWRNNNNNN